MSDAVGRTPALYQQIPPDLIFHLKVHCARSNGIAVFGPYLGTPNDFRLLLTKCSQILASLDLDPNIVEEYLQGKPFAQLDGLEVCTPDGEERVLEFGLAMEKAPAIATCIRDMLSGFRHTFGVYTVRLLNPLTYLPLPYPTPNSAVPGVLRSHVTQDGVPMYAIEEIRTFLVEEKAKDYAIMLLVRKDRKYADELLDMDGVWVGWILMNEQALMRVATVTRVLVSNEARRDAVAIKANLSLSIANCEE